MKKIYFELSLLILCVTLLGFGWLYKIGTLLYSGSILFFYVSCLKLNKNDFKPKTKYDRELRMLERELQKSKILEPEEKRKQTLKPIDTTIYALILFYGLFISVASKDIKHKPTIHSGLIIWFGQVILFIGYGMWMDGKRSLGKKKTNISEQ